MRKLLLLLSIFFYVNNSFSQCNRTEVITVCDMETIDKDGNGTPDGIINLYEQFTNATGETITNGRWVDPQRYFVLDESTGDLRTWDLPNATESLTYPSKQGYYIFELYNSDCGDSTPALTIQLNLGPFSGYATIPPRNSEANVQFCYFKGSQVCDVEQSFNLDLAINSVPSAHQNGTWVYLGNSPNFRGIYDRSFKAVIPYTPGGTLIDEETFDFEYIVKGEGCATERTKVKISVVRGANSGIANTIRICEDDVISGSYNNIDLTGDNYLIGEDFEGNWSSNFDPTNQISNGADSIVNLQEVYNNIISRNPRFEHTKVDFTYTVQDRSLVCPTDNSTVEFIFVEKIRPMSQKNEIPSFCYGDSGLKNINLYDQIEFTTENNVLYDYPSNRGNYWVFTSTPGIITRFLDVNTDWEIDPEDTSKAIITKAKPKVDLSFLTNLEANEYTFEYVVPTSYNLVSEDSNDEIVFNQSECGYVINEFVCETSETATIKVVLKPIPYAGENTTGLVYCETFFENPIDLTTLLNQDPTKGAIATAGTWLNTDTNEKVTNPFSLSDITENQVFNFQYTTDEVNGCSDISTLKFTVQNVEEAGQDSTHEACKTDTSLDIFGLLEDGVSTKGTWKLPDSSTTTDNQLVINPSEMAVGSYEYIYTTPQNGKCSGESSTLTLNILDPYAGENTTGLEFCESFFENPVDLTTLLEKDATRDDFIANGTWMNVDTNTALTNPFTLPTITSSQQVFNFEYTVTIGSCEDKATLTFTVYTINNAGAEATKEVCSYDASFSAFAELGSDASQNGSWTLPNGDTFDDYNLMIDPSSAEAGNYVYTTDNVTSSTGEVLCNGTTATLTLSITQVYAGEDTLDVTFCESEISNPINLSELLNKESTQTFTETGTWVNTDTGETVTSSFTVATLTTQEQTFNFEYTANSSNCTETSRLTFVVYRQNYAGENATKEVCSSGIAFEAFAELGSDVSQNGTWQLPNGDTVNSHNLSIDPATATSGDYVYTVPANGNCEATSATLTVNITQQPFAGEDSEATLCTSSIQVDLFDLIDTEADRTGVFIDADGNTLSSSILSVENITPDSYTYTYQIADGTVCSGDTATLTLTIEEPEAPIVQQNQTFCAVERVPTLEDLTIENTTNFEWYETETSTEVLSIDTQLQDGEDYYVVSLNDNDCSSKRVRVQVNFTPLNTNGCDSCISSVVSPNGDGTNDVFDLCELPTLYPNFELKIFNRYGTVVYTGDRNSESFDGKDLPTGVYFYIFTPNDSVTSPIQSDFYLGN